MVERQRRKLFLFPGRRQAPVSEHDMDMRRMAPRSGTLATRIRVIVGRLVPNGGGVGPPTRAIDRELEDSWPSLNRI